MANSIGNIWIPKRQPLQLFRLCESPTEAFPTHMQDFDYFVSRKLEHVPVFPNIVMVEVTDRSDPYYIAFPLDVFYVTHATL